MLLLVRKQTVAQQRVTVCCTHGLEPTITTVSPRLACMAPHCTQDVENALKLPRWTVLHLHLTSIVQGKELSGPDTLWALQTLTPARQATRS